MSGKPSPQLIAHQQTRTVQRSGPLPDPEELRAYEAILPGVAARIIQAADEERRHRHVLERRVIALEITDTRAARRQVARGQYLAFFLCLSLIIAACYTVHQGHGWPAATMGLGGLASLVFAFTRTSGKSEPEKAGE